MPQYAIAISERTLDLIEFLNDGVRPQIEDKPTYFVCSIVAPNEISAKIESEDELYNANGLAKDYVTILL